MGDNPVSHGCGVIVLKDGRVLYFYELWCRFRGKPPPVGSMDYLHPLSWITVPAITGKGMGDPFRTRRLLLSITSHDVQVGASIVTWHVWGPAAVPQLHPWVFGLC